MVYYYFEKRLFSNQQQSGLLWPFDNIVTEIATPAPLRATIHKRAARLCWVDKFDEP